MLASYSVFRHLDTDLLLLPLVLSLINQPAHPKTLEEGKAGLQEQVARHILSEVIKFCLKQIPTKNKPRSKPSPGMSLQRFAGCCCPLPWEKELAQPGRECL